MTDSALSASQGKARLLVMRDTPGPISSDSDLSDLKYQLCLLPEFHDVELTQNGRSTVLAYVPAVNKRQIDHLKAVANSKLRGWKIIDEQSYGLPTTY